MAYSNYYARISMALSGIKSSFGTVFRFAPSLIYSGLIIIFQALAWFQAWYIKHNLSGDILVLHYNVDFGIDLVGDPRQIYLFPLLGLGIYLLNLIILASLYKDKNFKIFTHLLLGAAVLFALFLVLALLSVYLINFR